MKKPLVTPVLLMVFVAACARTAAPASSAAVPPKDPQQRAEFLAKVPPEAAKIIVEYRLDEGYFDLLGDDQLAELHVDPAQVRSASEFAGYDEFLAAGTAWAVACYQDQGIAAHLDPPGSNRIVFDVAPGHGGDIAANPAVDFCNAEATLLFPPGPSFDLATDEDRQARYQYTVDVARCLQDEGYAIDIPSYDVWAGELHGGWSGWSEIPDELPQREWQHLREVCDLPFPG
ncbi:MAG TPA: hypothetical protein ENH00_01150 [Actinobacteria bacterium]|nr:hypothetical protein BMS3Bbin01_01168 [bacterium BMS3Bbin01]HDH24785.1 hypothetical protein [Actinomycetota bacterium]